MQHTPGELVPDGSCQQLRVDNVFIGGGCCGCVVKVGSDGDVVLYVDCDGWMLSVEVLVITLFDGEGSDPVPSNEGTGSSEEPSTLLLPPIHSSNGVPSPSYLRVVDLQSV